MFDGTGDWFIVFLLAMMILGFVMSVMAFLQGDMVFVWLGGLLLGAGFGLWTMDD